MSEQQTVEVRVRDDLDERLKGEDAAAAAIAPDALEDAPEAEPGAEPEARSETDTVTPSQDSSALNAARAAVIAACERIGEVARSTDLEFVQGQLSDLRAHIMGVDPASLTPRRGLAGLFDSSRKRLRRFRDHVIDLAPAVSTAAVKLRDAASGLNRRNAVLNEERQGLLDRLGELDAALTAFSASDAALAQDRPLSELVDRLDSEVRTPATPNHLHAAALGHLSLTRMIQNVDVRLADAVAEAAEAVARWRDQMLQALGAEGKKLTPLRKVRLDPAALSQTCEACQSAIDRMEAALGAARQRREDAMARLDRALTAGRREAI